MMDKDIVDGFREETNSLLKELALVVDGLEKPASEFPSSLMSEFSQKIDRIMGTAITLQEMFAPGHLGLKRIGNMAELCKKLGIMAVVLKDMRVIPLFSAFWADTLEVIEDLVRELENELESARLALAFSDVLEGRLRWLAKKVKKMAEAKGYVFQESEKMTNGAVDIDQLMSGLLKELGY